MFCPGQNFMNDLDKVIKGTFIELDMAWAGRNDEYRTLKERMEV